MNNAIGIVVSFVFVFALIAASAILFKYNIISNEGSRKFIHIGVSNWWIIAMVFFNNSLYACIVPASFVIINYISYKRQIFRSMERDGSINDLGTVYYAVSLLILSIITFSKQSSPYIGALGILVMGYGDGLAAVIGRKYGRHRYRIFGNEKTIEGSAAMLLISFIVCFAVLSLYNPSKAVFAAFILAVVSSAVEALSPYGLDNITVPLLCSFVYTMI